MSIFNHVTGQQGNRIQLKTQNQGYYAVQGHRNQYKSKAYMRLPISD